MVISENMQFMVKNSSAIRRLFEEGLEMAEKIGKENVYDFSLGNPSVPAPAKVDETIINVLKNEDSLYIHGYMKNAGHDAVREKVAAYLNRHFNAGMNKDNIVMSVGAAGAICLVLRTLLNPGDEVICFAPFFGEYKSYTSNFAGKVVSVPANTDDFQLNLKDFPALVTEKTKVVILNSPNNPTGVIYSAETLKAFGSLLEEAEKKGEHLQD